MRLLAAAILLVALPAAAQDAEDQAGNFDGLYRASPTTDCAVVGGDGGALKIEGDVFFGAETRCQMTNPVKVRDMNARLYDMVCEAGGTSFTERAMLMHAADGGLVMVWDGFAFKYEACPEDPALGTVTTADDLGIAN